MADRANVFNTLYVTFYEDWRRTGNRDACWPTFEAILGIAQATADKSSDTKFLDDYKEQCEKAEKQTGKPDLSLPEMSAVVRAAWGLMTRVGLYDWKKSPEDTEDITGVLIQRAAP